MYGSLWNNCECLIYPLATIFFWKISTQWVYFCLIGYLLSFWALVSSFFLPESPRFLIDQQKLDDAEKSCKIIAVWNKTTEMVFNADDFRMDETIDKLDGSNSSLTSTKGEVAVTSSESRERPTLMYFLRQRQILINVLVMAFIWLSTSFNYYLIQYLINSFEAVYMSAIGSSIADIAAITVSAFLYERYGIKANISMANAASTIGGILILFYALQHQKSWSFPVLVMFTKFGVTFTFNVLYISHVSLFPVLFAATALGLCNMVARLFSAISPILA